MYFSLLLHLLQLIQVMAAALAAMTARLMLQAMVQVKVKLTSQ